jgi:hypothetical protein
MTEPFLRKVYSHHGLANWARAVDVLQSVEGALEEEFALEKPCADSISTAIMQIVARHRSKKVSL